MSDKLQKARKSVKNSFKSCFGSRNRSFSRSPPRKGPPDTPPGPVDPLQARSHSRPGLSSPSQLTQPPLENTHPATSPSHQRLDTTHADVRSSQEISRNSVGGSAVPDSEPPSRFGSSPTATDPEEEVRTSQDLHLSSDSDARRSARQKISSNRGSGQAQDDKTAPSRAFTGTSANVAIRKCDFCRQTGRDCICPPGSNTSTECSRVGMRCQGAIRA